MTEEVLRPLPGEASKSKGRPCLYGCLAMVAIGCLVGVVGAIAAYHYGSAFLQKMVEEYTDAAPAEIPEVTLSDERMAELESRLSDFKGALDGNVEMDTLVLSAEEINALIQRYPEFQRFGRWVYVTIEGETVKGKISVPLDTLKLPGWLGAKGRYLNGSGTFSVSVSGGTLYVFLESMTIKGKPAPEQFMAALRAQNLAEGPVEEPGVRAVLERIKDVVIENGRLKVTLKPRS